MVKLIHVWLELFPPQEVPESEPGNATVNTNIW